MSDEAEQAFFDAAPSAFEAPAAPPVAPYRGGTFARLALVGLAVSVVADLMGVVAVGVVRWSVAQDAHYDEWGEWVAPAWVLLLDTVPGTLGLLALLFTGVVFLTWFSRIHAYAASRAEVPFPSGWASGPVLGWFIPIGSLWLPYQRMSEVWTVLLRRPHGLVVLWWALWVGGNFFSRVTNYEPDSTAELEAFFGLMVADHTLGIVTALLAARIVFVLDQAARFEGAPSSF